MTANPPLPSLDGLFNICRKHKLPLELSPPVATPPKAGELIFNQPLDPMLAALYQRMGEATVGTFSLFRSDQHPEKGLLPRNEIFKRDGSEPFRSTLLFGKKTGFSYYLGTVPALADSAGLQPIVYIPFYPAEVFSAPIASNLDRFFDTYSRYLELMVVDDDYVETGIPGVTFPWDVAHLVAQDGALIELLRVGRFSPLVGNDREAQEWVSTVLTMAK